MEFSDTNYVIECKKIYNTSNGDNEITRFELHKYVMNYSLYSTDKLLIAVYYGYGEIETYPYFDSTSKDDKEAFNAFVRYIGKITNNKAIHTLSCNKHDTEYVYDIDVIIDNGNIPIVRYTPKTNNIIFTFAYCKSRDLERVISLLECKNIFLFRNSQEKFEHIFTEYDKIDEIAYYSEDNKTIIIDTVDKKKIIDNKILVSSGLKIDVSRLDFERTFLLNNISPSKLVVNNNDWNCN